MGANMASNNPEHGGPYQPLPGDRILRIPRLQPWRITISRSLRPHPSGISWWTLVYGFAGMIAAGTILLMFPISSNSGEWTSPVNCLFTATSAVCVTGLVVVDTLDHWNYFGQFVILLLIQLGGLGFMTSATILLMAAGRRIGLRDRILIGESIGASSIGGVVRLVRNILFFTLIAESVGALIFYVRFSAEYGWWSGIWKSVFQAVSAFNNAGFDLFGGFRSLSGYSTDWLVLLTTAALIVLGGISFMALQNTFHSRGLKKSSVDTKLVLLITAVLLILGTLVVLVIEYSNPQTLGNLSWPYKFLNAFFQSVTSRTAGFNVINIGALSIDALFFIILLMFIGGASGSTAGGIKVNTLGIIAATVWNTIKGKENAGAFGREFPVQLIFRAITLLVISLGLIALVFMLLSFTEDQSSIKILFETVSAFGTVGLTTGITPELSIAGKIIVVFTMFIGRLGPLTLTLALTGRQQPSSIHYPKETVRIG